VNPDSTRQPTEEELRAAYEEEIKRIRVEHVLLENVVTLINLGMRRTGVVAGTEPERDLGQVRIAIESVRALLPLVEEVAPEQSGPVRQALSQLQLSYVQLGGEGAATQAGSSAAGSPMGPESDPAHPDPAHPTPDGSAPASGGATPEAESEPPRPGEPGPAQRSGRLWVPGQ
jgi:hypothetical protein